MRTQCYMEWINIKGIDCEQNVVSIQCLTNLKSIVRSKYLVASAVLAKTLTRRGLAARIAWQSEIPEGTGYEDAI